MVGAQIIRPLMAALAVLLLAVVFSTAPSVAEAHPFHGQLADGTPVLMVSAHGAPYRAAGAGSDGGVDFVLGCHDIGPSCHSGPAIVGAMIGFPPLSRSRDELSGVPVASGQMSRPPPRPPRTSFIDIV